MLLRTRRCWYAGNTPCWLCGKALTVCVPMWRCVFVPMGGCVLQFVCGSRSSFTKYTGARTANGVANYVRVNSFAPTTILADSADATAFMSSGEVVVIGAFESPASPEAIEFRKATACIRGITVGITYDSDVAQTVRWCVGDPRCATSCPNGPHPRLCVFRSVLPCPESACSSSTSLSVRTTKAQTSHEPP